VIAIITLFVTLFGSIAGISIAYFQLRRTPILNTEAQITGNAWFRMVWVVPAFRCHARKTDNS